MFRAAHASLMILSLLLCPFRCMGAVEVPRASGVKNSSGCRCCQHKAAQRPDHDSSPGRPDSDCGCGSCLCHGAVVPDKVCVDVDHTVALAPPCIHVDNFVECEMRDLNRWQATYPPDPLGRDVCVRLQRFLI